MNRWIIRTLAGRPAAATAALALAALLSACGGNRPGDNGSPDASVLGSPCQFDSDCQPPSFICGTLGTCEAGCTAGSCAPGKTCNVTTGHCTGTATDGGTDAGTDGGTDAGADAGVASATLCHGCTHNSDCAGPTDLCVSNTQHTAHYCAQDCTNAPCPPDYQCVFNGTNIHQCLPVNHTCPNDSDGGTGDGGPSDGGTDAGPVDDPNVPSDNPDGCKMCGQCMVNNDCVIGGYCVSGICGTPCSQSGLLGTLECIAKGGSLFSTCSDVGLPNGQTVKLCLSLFGQCVPLPAPLTPLSGDVTCMPQGYNKNCAIPTIPSPALGANVAVTSNLPTAPILASEDYLARDSQGRMVIGYIGVDSSGNSYMGVSRSTDNGATWVDKGKMKTSVSGAVQSDPVVVVSKWTDGSGAHERMHYVWVTYVIDSSSSYGVTNMFMEASYSDDGGATWTNGAKVTTTTDNAGGSLLLDKPWIAVGPDGTLAYTFSVGDNSQQHMYASISVDHGVSWLPKKLLYGTAEGSNNNYGHNLGMAVFDPADPTGNKLWAIYVRYTQTAATTDNTIQLVKSTDKGATWTDVGPVSAATDQVLFEPPSITMDKNGHVYVGYIASPSGVDSRYWDAMVATIDVLNATPAVAHYARASDDSASCFQHIHPMVVADPTSGNLAVGWLDNRKGGKGGTYYAISTNQGASFGTSKRVSDADYTFNPDHANSQLNFLGDYFGVWYDGTTIRLTWSDPRDGKASQVFYAGGTP